MPSAGRRMALRDNGIDDKVYGAGGLLRDF